ncbi:MAG: RNA-binding protein [Myxococcales bacterium]
MEPKRARSAHRRTELVISSKIFVGNLNFATTDDELRQLFGEVGEVVDVHIPKDRETGRPRGFAFVRFASEDQAKQAVEQLHGREVGGRALRLDIAEDRPRPPRPRRDFKSSPDRRGGNAPRHADDLPRADFDSQDYFDRGSYGREDYSHDDDQGGRGGKSGSKPKRPKGSRRGIRGKKRSL